MSKYTNIEIDSSDLAKLQTQMEQFRSAFFELGRAVSTALGATFEAIRPVIQQIYDYFHNAYLEAGAPYGDTPEGLQRWLEEVAAAERTRYELELALQRERELASMRELGRRIGEKIKTEQRLLN